MIDVSAKPVWKITLKTDGGQKTADIYAQLLAVYSDAVAVHHEAPDHAGKSPQNYVVECYRLEKPDQTALALVLQVVAKAHALTLPSMQITLLPPKNWLAENRESFPALHAGRFFIYSACYKGKIPRHAIQMKIEANTAFGTGSHGTTRSCLQAIDDLIPAFSVKHALDLGCGTGILAIGLAKITRTNIWASDLDKEAVRVCKANLLANDVGSRVKVIKSNGFHHAHLQRGPKFDLILANILANPLKKLAPEMRRFCQKNGRLILSGILNWQQRSLWNIYRQHGFQLQKYYHDGPWVTLVLKKY